MAASILDTVSSQIEYVERNVERFYEASNQLAKLIQSMPAVTISRYLGRVPFMRTRGGVMSKVSKGATGVLPEGTGPVLSHLTFGVIYSARGYQVTEEQEDTSATSDQAVMRIGAELISGAFQDMVIDDDITAHGVGDGTLTNPCSSPVASGAGTTTATFIFAGATDYLRLGKLRVGMAVEVWSQTGGTKRAAASTAPTVILSLDYATNTVVLSQNITNACPAGSQDVFAVVGLDTYGPATLVTGSATWPQTGLAPGLGGDSWRHGILYAHDVSTGVSYLGRSRATFPELASNRVNANSNALTWSHGRLGMDAIILRGQAENVTGLIGIAHMAQIKAMEDISINLTSILGQSGLQVNTTADLAAFDRSYGKPTPYCGIPVYKSKRQARNRIDFINLPTWVRAEFHKPRYAKGGDYGQYLYRGRSTSTARPMTYYEFWVEQAYDLVCRNPMLSFYIDSLQVPAGY